MQIHIQQDQIRLRQYVIKQGNINIVFHQQYEFTKLIISIASFILHSGDAFIGTLS